MGPEFPSPHSGILFLSPTTIAIYKSAFGTCFRPLIRGFFFYAGIFSQRFPVPRRGVSVPSFGDSFFIYINTVTVYIDLYGRFRPLIRGFFFYNTMYYIATSKRYSGFRPLIRGFFFYCMIRETIRSTPSCFRPLIRGFFFYG